MDLSLRRACVAPQVSRVVALPRFAYAGRADAPPGLGDPATTPVEFEVELLDFEREGYWQVWRGGGAWDGAAGLEAGAAGGVGCGVV